MNINVLPIIIQFKIFCDGVTVRIHGYRRTILQCWSPRLNSPLNDRKLIDSVHCCTQDECRNGFSSHSTFTHSHNNYWFHTWQTSLNHLIYLETPNRKHFNSHLDRPNLDCWTSFRTSDEQKSIEGLATSTASIKLQTPNLPRGRGCIYYLGSIRPHNLKKKPMKCSDFHVFDD